MDKLEILARDVGNAIAYTMIAKKCLRCGGRLYIECDTYGTYETCLQCGYTRDLKVEEKEDESL